MATFTLSANSNITDLTGKAGADTYNLNGYTLTIDTDSRYGLNQNTSATLGDIACSSTLGGECHIDGTAIRIIPFDTGTGNVPTDDTTISQGSASGKLIGVWSSFTSSPTAAGSAMPASGYIKIRQWNSTEYAAGALTGISANATGASQVGWLEIIGAETKSVTSARLGMFRITGTMMILGTTSGSSNQTLQIPTSGLGAWFGGVFIEKTADAGDWEFWPNAGTTTGIATDSTRGKVVWIDGVTNYGLVRIGNDGSTTAGYTPPSGRRIGIPNVFCHNATVATPTANAYPNSTYTTRYDFNTSSYSGNIDISHASVSWYLYFAAATDVLMEYVSAVEWISVSSSTSTVDLYRCGIGQIAALSDDYSSTLNIQNITDSCSIVEVVATVGTNTAGQVAIILAASRNIVMSDCKAIRLPARTMTTLYTLSAISDATINRPVCIGGRLYVSNCFNCTVNDLIYADTAVGTTGTSNGTFAVDVTNGAGNTINGVTIPVANTQPYAQLVGLYTTYDAVVKNIGSYASPLSLGSANKTGYLIYAAGCTNTKVMRVYVDTVRSIMFYGADSPSSLLTLQNCMVLDGTGTFTPVTSNPIIKGYRASAAPAASQSNAGMHFIDYFTSDTAGLVAIMTKNWKTTVEPSASSYEVTAGNPRFSGAASGGLMLPAVGDQIVYTWPWYVIGHTGFANSNPTFSASGISSSNVSVEYQIDKNDGNGWNGTWITATGANLSAETGIDASLGFKLRVRLTCTSANTGYLTQLTITTTSSTTAQAYQYQLGSWTVTLTGLVAGTEIHAYLGTDPATCTEIAGTESSGTTYSFTQSEGTGSGFITLIKPGYKFLTIPVTFDDADVSIPIFQAVDRDYSNPA